ncbi:MAG: hypothetical protein M3Q03_08275 [Chloroflexota bacterium]|nr:hypothetical protein [Chloroflexota bacterium]
MTTGMEVLRGPTRTIFRPEAIQRRARAANQIVLPRFTTPLAAMCIWLLVGLLGAGGVAAWLARVPVTVSAPAALVTTTDRSAGDLEEVVGLVFLPPPLATPMRPGREVVLVIGDETLHGVLESVEPRISGPAEVQQRFSLSGAAAQAVSQPSLVGLVQIEPRPGGLPATSYVGSTGRAEVSGGTRRLASFLPGAGQFFT